MSGRSAYPHVAAGSADTAIDDGFRRALRRTLSWAAIYLSIAIIATWPLLVHIGDSIPSTWGDAKQTTYGLAWDAHALAHNPSGLFQEPIFYPERDALAFTDHLSGLGVFAAPIIWATGNIYFAHNVLFILAIAFSGIAVALVVYEITKNNVGALVAGAAFAVSPYWFGSIVNLSHIQIVAVGWLPMAAFGLWRWWRAEQVRYLFLTAISVGLATLTSWYQAAFLCILAPILVLGCLPGTPRAKLIRLSWRGLLAALIVVAVVVPFSLPYIRVQHRYADYTRTIDVVAPHSANLTSYLSAPPKNLLYGNLTARWREVQTSPETNLFTGVTVLILAGIGLWDLGSRQKRRATITFLVVIGFGVVLSFGASTSGVRSHSIWAFLHDHFSLFRALRGAGRAHVLTILGLAVLAGFGAVRVTKTLDLNPKALGALMIATLALEGTSIPLRLAPAVKAPAAYRVIAGREGGVLELPTRFRINDHWAGVQNDLDAMLRSVGDWRPRANGGSGYFPRSYLVLIRALQTFPDERSLEMIRSRGVRTLIVRADALGGTPWIKAPSLLMRWPGVTLIERSGAILIFDVAR
jgi:hypothetical protein